MPGAEGSILSRHVFPSSVHIRYFGFQRFHRNCLISGFCFMLHPALLSVDCLGTSWKQNIILDFHSVAVLKRIMYSHNHSGSNSIFSAGLNSIYNPDTKFISYLNLNSSIFTFIAFQKTINMHVYTISLSNKILRDNLNQSDMYL